MNNEHKTSQPSTRKRRPIRRLPDLKGVAEDMDGVFDPGDCRSGEVLVRKGKIRSTKVGVVDCVMAYCADEGAYSFMLYTNHYGKWSIHTGGTSSESQRAIDSVLGGSEE